MYKYESMIFYYGHINEYYEDGVCLDGLINAGISTMTEKDKKYFSIMYKVPNLLYSTIIDRLELISRNAKLMEEIK